MKRFIYVMSKTPSNIVNVFHHFLKYMLLHFVVYLFEVIMHQKAVKNDPKKVLWRYSRGNVKLAMALFWRTSPHSTGSTFLTTIFGKHVFDDGEAGRGVSMCV